MRFFFFVCCWNFEKKKKFCLAVRCWFVISIKDSVNMLFFSSYNNEHRVNGNGIVVNHLLPSRCIDSQRGKYRIRDVEGKWQRLAFHAVHMTEIGRVVQSLWTVADTSNTSVSPNVWRRWAHHKGCLSISCAVADKPWKRLVSTG